MRPQPPGGTYLMGIEINDDGSGDALHSLKQKLPRGGEGRGEDPDRLEDAAPPGLPAGAREGDRQCVLVHDPERPQRVLHGAEMSHAQDSCVAKRGMCA